MDVLPLRRKALVKIEMYPERIQLYIMERILANVDLKRHIFSFGEPAHRDRMKQVSDGLAIRVEPIQHLFEDNRGERSLYDYLRDEYTAQELIATSRYLNRCKCCTRHSHYKPYLEYVEGVQEVRIPSHPVHHGFPLDCECACRTMSRCMMRVYLHHHLEID